MIVNALPRCHALPLSRWHGIAKQTVTKCCLYWGGYPHPCDFSQTKAYIEKQLTYAGHPNAIFSEDAIKAVLAFSSGIPRLINRACTQSLVYAYQNRRAIIDDRMVQLVLEGEVSWIPKMGMAPAIPSLMRQNRPATKQLGGDKTRRPPAGLSGGLCHFTPSYERQLSLAATLEKIYPDILRWITKMHLGSTLWTTLAAASASKAYKGHTYGVSQRYSAKNLPLSLYSLFSIYETHSTLSDVFTQWFGTIPIM